MRFSRRERSRALSDAGRRDRRAHTALPATPTERMRRAQSPSRRRVAPSGGGRSSSRRPRCPAPAPRSSPSPPCPPPPRPAPTPMSTFTFDVANRINSELRSLRLQGRRQERRPSTFPPASSATPTPPPSASSPSSPPSQCPVDSQVGVVEVAFSLGPGDVRASALDRSSPPSTTSSPRPTEPGLLAFKTGHRSTPRSSTTSAPAPTATTALDATVSNIDHVAPAALVPDRSLWGVPADPIHDYLRFGFGPATPLLQPRQPSTDLLRRERRPSTADPATMLSALCSEPRSSTIPSATDRSKKSPDGPVSSNSPLNALPPEPHHLRQLLARHLARRPLLRRRHLPRRLHLARHHRLRPAHLQPQPVDRSHHHRGR